MKFIICAAFCLALLSAGCGLKDGDVRRSVPGGFSEASVKDEEVVEAAEFAAGSPEAERVLGGDAVLVEIISAEHQVVAGMNYRLVLEIESCGETHFVEAVVWRKLSGDYELVSWRPRE